MVLENKAWNWPGRNGELGSVVKRHRGDRDACSAYTVFLQVALVVNHQSQASAQNLHFSLFQT